MKATTPKRPAYATTKPHSQECQSIVARMDEIAALEPKPADYTTSTKYAEHKRAWRGTLTLWARALVAAERDAR